MKVSRKRSTTRKKRKDNKRKTTKDRKSRASGALQYKIWRPGEKQHTTAKNNDNLQNKMWDLGRQKFKQHDLEIMVIFYLGSLMQEHQLGKMPCIFIKTMGLMFL